MYAHAREVAECTWDARNSLYRDALPKFQEIVVRFREKVGDFQRLSVGFCKIHNGLLPIFRVMWQ